MKREETDTSRADYFVWEPGQMLKVRRASPSEWSGILSVLRRVRRAEAKAKGRQQ